MHTTARVIEASKYENSTEYFELQESILSPRIDTENLLKSAFKLSDLSGDYTEEYLFSQIPRKSEMVFKKKKEL